MSDLQKIKDKSFAAGVDEGVKAGKLVGLEKAAWIAETYANRMSEGWGIEIASKIREEINR